MGIDATITFKTADEGDLHLPNKLPDGCEIRRRSGPHDDGVMYEVDQDYRYYGPGYERGPWPEIASVLMILLASEDVVSVWYHGDIQEEPGSPLTIDEVLEYSAHYMRKANRPYCKRHENLR